MTKRSVLIFFGLFAVAHTMPQNGQGENINWNEEPQERPNTMPMASARPNYGSSSSVTFASPTSSSCSMENGVRRCSLGEDNSPRECHNGHLHVLTGYGYNGFHQNQRYVGNI